MSSRRGVLAQRLAPVHHCAISGVGATALYPLYRTTVGFSYIRSTGWEHARWIDGAEESADDKVSSETVDAARCEFDPTHGNDSTLEALSAGFRGQFVRWLKRV